MQKINPTATLISLIFLFVRLGKAHMLLVTECRQHSSSTFVLVFTTCFGQEDLAHSLVLTHSSQCICPRHLNLNR